MISSLRSRACHVLSGCTVLASGHGRACSCSNAHQAAAAQLAARYIAAVCANSTLRASAAVQRPSEHVCNSVGCAAASSGLGVTRTAHGACMLSQQWDPYTWHAMQQQHTASHIQAQLPSYLPPQLHFLTAPCACHASPAAGTLSSLPHPRQYFTPTPQPQIVIMSRFLAAALLLAALPALLARPNCRSDYILLLPAVPPLPSPQPRQ